jgi:N utilization substance protein A
VDPDTQTALVIVPDYQLSLAIGREGQNARLAARLTGWRIDIKSETQFADEQRGGPRPVAGQVAAGAAAPSPASAPLASQDATAAPAGDAPEGGAESGAGSAPPAEGAATAPEGDSVATAPEGDSVATAPEDDSTAAEEDESAPSTDDPAKETVVVEEAAEEKAEA